MFYTNIPIFKVLFRFRLGMSLLAAQFEPSPNLNFFRVRGRKEITTSLLITLS